MLVDEGWRVVFVNRAPVLMLLLSPPPRRMGKTAGGGGGALAGRGWSPMLSPAELYLG